MLFSNLGIEMAGICMFKSLDVNFLSRTEIFHDALNTNKSMGTPIHIINNKIPRRNPVVIKMKYNIPSGNEIIKNKRFK